MQPAETSYSSMPPPSSRYRAEERAAIERIRRRWVAQNRANHLVFAQIHYSHVKPIVQQGPTCGIVALGMIATVVTNYTVHDIFHLALKKEYTLKGEMFNAFDMYALAVAVLGEFFEITMITDGMRANEKMIIKDLTQSTLYLVPYDANYDDTPGLYFGHRAHWAVLCGVIQEEGDKFTILAHQGKSRDVGLWSFDNLQRSNANLIGISPVRLFEGGYKVHDIRRTLARKCIRLKPKIFS